MDVEIHLTDAVPFDAAMKWAEQYSDYAVTWIPKYSNKKTQKRFQQWLKQRPTS